ncbi:baseplate J/gp47 family protein [Acidisoma cellulosilytica]|uniref:Baseplate J/gp47 family protein n=1 Tax=Acidisoma cellulosilyticum TaxID=2802395 RepID=A0A963Z0G5_9PROT|nr:baseplate J/gp47 family protein [Acidisoma cellulosilyticum]MCB8880420.1 baseplate J/gp47 family protein [Acidisoma cellulosilyticum]
MQLSLQNFTTLVQQAAAAVQASAAQLLDFSLGSVLRAILEANASIALWLQWLILLVLQTTRLASSSGLDADSFGADFGFARLAALAATGSVTFSRYTATMAAFVPAGATVTTADNASQFTVATDDGNSAWSASQSGYVIGAGVASVTLPVTAVVAGAAGNVLSGSITLIASAMPGIDTVSNADALTGGLDAETDNAFRQRFQSFIDSRTRATIQAVTYAAYSVQQGISCTVQENSDGSGNYLPGHFVVTVDDGSGNPPPSLLSAVQIAVDAVRPIGSSFAIQAPNRIAADISLTLTLANGADSALVIATVNAAIASYVNALGVGMALPYTRIAQLAYDASPSVQNVNGLTLQGGSADLPASASAVIKLGTLAIS